MNPPVVIGSGTHAVVERGSQVGTVVKRFVTPSSERNAMLAQQEYDHLAAFSAALRAFPLLNCPEPIDVNVHEATVTMTHCPGIPVSDLINDSIVYRKVDFDFIAQQLAVASVVYVSTLRTPYNDMGFKHALYDPESRMLSLVDFSGRLRVEPELAKIDPLSASVGIFIGRTVLGFVGLRKIPSQSLWSRHRWLTVEVSRYICSERPVDRDVVRKAVEEILQKHRTRQSDLLRRAWYRTIGKWLYERRSRAIVAILGE